DPAGIPGRGCVSYPSSGGTTTFHFAPGFMRTRASCQPLMTPLTGNVAAWPRENELSNSVPSIKDPRYCTVTVSVGCGEAALVSPGTRTWYSSPVAVVLTPFSWPL